MEGDLRSFPCGPEHPVGEGSGQHSHQLLEHFHCATRFRAAQEADGLGPHWQSRGTIASSEHRTQIKEETFLIAMDGLSCCAKIRAER